MMAVLKSVGKGILYIIGLPFFLIVLALVAVSGIFVLIFMFIKSIFLFFTGRSLDDELPEDRKAREIREGKPAFRNSSDELVISSEPQVQPAPQNIEEVVFGPATPIEEEEESPVIETIPSQEPVEEPAEEPIIEDIIDTSPVQEEEPVIKETPKPVHEKEVVMGEYIPHTQRSRIIEEEAEEEDSGVTITFGDDDE